MEQLELAVRAANDDPRQVAPEFEWVKKGEKWVATNGSVTRKLFSARPSRVVVTPGKPAIYVHGGESLTWLAYLNGGTQPRGQAFKECLAELQYLVGLSKGPPDKRRRPTKALSSPLKTKVEPPIEAIPDGDPQPFTDRWPFKAAYRVHKYGWGFVVYPKKGEPPVPCRPSSIGLICGIREGTYAQRGALWVAPKGKPGEQLRGIPGVSPENLTTYRCSQVVEAIAIKERVWFVEGEKDVETLEGVGLVADTNPFGAGKLTLDQAQAFKGGSVVLIPDNDPAGIKGAKISGLTMLEAGAVDVRVLDPLGDAKGYDVTDFVTEHGSENARAELEERASQSRQLEAAPVAGLEAVHQGAKVAAAVVVDAIERIEQAKSDPESVYGIRTGIPRLDHLTLGLNPGLLILAAPPSLGKTTLAQSIALHACKADEVLYLSWEHSAKSLMLRMVCTHASMDTMAVRRGQINFEQFRSAYDEIVPSLRHLHILETDPTLTLERLRSMIESISARAAVSGRRLLVVVDYLQMLARVSAELQAADPRGKVDRLSGSLIALSHAACVPVLAISSQHREAYKGGQTSSSYATLKESGSLEYDADLVMMLTTPDGDDPPPDERILNIAKHREGPLGSVRLRMDVTSGRVYEVSLYED